MRQFFSRKVPTNKAYLKKGLYLRQSDVTETVNVETQMRSAKNPRDGYSEHRAATSLKESLGMYSVSSVCRTNAPRLLFMLRISESQKCQS